MRKRKRSTTTAPRRGRSREPVRFGVIGGSGLYAMAALEGAREVRLRTPFGEPSDALVVGRIDGVGVAFLPRHGRGHRWLPSEINFRANVFALKMLGVELLLSVSAVGSLREEIRPGDVVLPSQFIDRTVRRESTFFGGGLAAHVPFADPTCAPLTAIVAAAARDDVAQARGGDGTTVHEGGTYVCMEGPQFSTRAESDLHRQWSADVIGMTNAQEAKLAREAELCFTTLALVTDYDCWNTQAGDVEVAEILRILAENTARVQRIVRAVASRLPAKRECACGSALEHAIITDPALVPARLRRALAPLVGRYLGGTK